jgi:hypothetical protein
MLEFAPADLSLLIDIGAYPPTGVLRLGTNLRMTRPININAPTIKTNPITSDVVAAAVESIVAAVMKVMIQASQMDNERGGFMTQVLPEFAPPICHP